MRCIAVLLGGLVLAASAAGSDRAERVEAARARLAGAEQALSARRLVEARELFQSSLELAEPLGPGNLPWTRAIDGLADVARLQGRPSDAEPLYVRAAAAWLELLGERQPRLATTLHNLGVVCLDLGKPVEARRHLERALAIWRETLGADSREARNTERALRRADGSAGPDTAAP